MEDNANNAKAVEAQIDNVLADDIDKFEHYAVANWKSIVTFSVSIVVVVVIMAIVLKVQNASDKKTVTVLENAKTIEELQKVISNNANHPAVVPAIMRLAQLYMNDKKYDNAIQEYNKIFKKNINSELKGRVKLNIGYIYELQNKLQDAMINFKTAATIFEVSSDIVSEANYSTARILILLNKQDDALSLLNSIKSSNNKTIWEFQSASLLNRIKCNPYPGNKK